VILKTPEIAATEKTLKNSKKIFWLRPDSIEKYL